MPVPPEYQRATEALYTFLEDLKKESNLATTHQVYTMTQAVFQAFRRRLNLKDTILFTNVLPAVLKAIFIDDWNLDEPQIPFDSVEKMTMEISSLREGQLSSGQPIDSEMEYKFYI
jgi:uncharacterized protein (DUF2267 family)